MNSSPRPQSETFGPRSLFLTTKLRKRIASGAAGIAIALLVVFATAEWPLIALVVLVGYFAAIEMVDLFGGTSRGMAVFSVYGAILCVWALSPRMIPPYAALAAVVIGTIGVILRARRDRPHPLDGLSLGWIAGPLACSVWLHQVSANPSHLFSSNLLALVLVPLWLGDTTAYFTGKAIGRTKLAPSISPNKTVEGAVANLIACVLGSFAVAHMLNGGLPTPLSPLAVTLNGVIVGVLGQIGDLLQSALKRNVGVKDSGSIIPGHGGVLDRIDSFLFAVVPASLSLWVLAGPGF